VLSGRGLYDELITRLEESYRLCCVVVCDLETSRIGAPYIYDISNLRVNQPCPERGTLNSFLSEYFSLLLSVIIPSGSPYSSTCHPVNGQWAYCRLQFHKYVPLPYH
jgi:hypothetical protein